MSRSHLTRFFAPVSLAALVLTSAVLATQDQAKSAEAAEIVVYSGRKESLIGPVIAKYIEKTGNPVRVKYGSSAGMAALILEEGDNTPADVFISQDAGALGAVAKKDRVRTLPASVMDRVEPRFRSPEGDWVGVSGRARSVVYNTKAMSPSDMPDSILDFTAPEWKGRVGWAPGNGSFQAFVSAMRHRLGDEATEEWLRGMIKNEAVVYPKNSAIVRAVGAGEVDLGFVNHYYLYRFLAEDPEFAARNHFLPDGDPGALVNVAGVCMPRQGENDAARTAAALDLINYLLGEEAQTYFAESTYEYPLIKGVGPAVEMISIDRIRTPDMDLGDMDDLEGTLALLRKVGALP